MSWSEVALGHFQRAIGENEAFIKMIGDPGHALGHEHWAVRAIVSYAYVNDLELDDRIERFKNAWTVLRFQQPSIAAVVGTTHLDYFVPDKQALQSWESETFMVHDSEDWADIAAHQTPTPYAVLHLFPKTDQVLLHTSHWRTDGIGILQLLDVLFDLASSQQLTNPYELPWGQETSRLAPAIEEAANLPLESDAEIHAEAAKWTKTFHETVDAVGIACDADKQTLPSGTRTVHTVLPKDTTSSIIKACKAQHISVTSAIHAALAHTNWEFALMTDKSKHYTSTIRAGLRSYLPEKYQTPAFSSGLYTSGYMHSIPSGMSFLENAQQLNQLYRAGLTDKYIRAHRQYALNLQDLIRDMPADSPPASDVDISSLGLVDKLIKPSHGMLKVTSVCVGVEILTRQMVCFVWTFQGQLNMCLVYNEAFYDAQVPKMFLESLVETLSKGLSM